MSERWLAVGADAAAEAQAQVDAVVDLITSGRVTDAQADQLGNAMAARSLGQFADWLKRMAAGA